MKCITFGVWIILAIICSIVIMFIPHAGVRNAALGLTGAGLFIWFLLGFVVKCDK